VIPATLDNVRLKMEWAETSLILDGERVIDAEFFKHDPRKADLSLTPPAKANPSALLAIEQADIVVIAPGDLYTSLGPLLVIDGIGEALEKTEALKIYVSNLVSKHGQTDRFTVSDHAAEIERFAGNPFLDYVIYNDEIPSVELATRYNEEGGYVTEVDKQALKKAHYKTVAGNFLGKMAKAHKGDSIPVTRSLIRHDAAAVAKSILETYKRERA
jgi:uncharacterized cofD-like protein